MSIMYSRISHMNIKISTFIENDSKLIDEMMIEISKEFDTPLWHINSSEVAKNIDIYWIAKIDESIVGTIGLVQLSNKSIILKRMFVKKKFRGATYKVSQTLLEYVIHWCSQNHFLHIYLGTMTQFAAAHRFYEKHGFVNIDFEALPHDFVNNPIDSIFYYLKIK